MTHLETQQSYVITSLIQGVPSEETDRHRHVKVSISFDPVLIFENTKTSLSKARIKMAQTWPKHGAHMVLYTKHYMDMSLGQS